MRLFQTVFNNYTCFMCSSLTLIPLTQVVTQGLKWTEAAVGYEPLDKLWRKAQSTYLMCKLLIYLEEEAPQFWCQCWLAKDPHSLKMYLIQSMYLRTHLQDMCESPGENMFFSKSSNCVCLFSLQDQHVIYFMISQEEKGKLQLILEQFLDPKGTV